MMGYNFDLDDEFGLCLAAARDLAIALDDTNTNNSAYQFGLGLRIEGPDRRVYIRGETEMLAEEKAEDGKYIPNPDYKIDQPHIDATEANKAEMESRVKMAEEHKSEIFAATSRAYPCIGGKLVVVDLAGAKFLSGITGASIKQTPLEKQKGKQINTDLLALKEVIRARSLASSRIPYRSSPLIMVPREHFEASDDAHSVMILTVSPGADQYAATMNTLKYGDLVGLANTHKR
ncbi:P-loop containing nucleoside triphosphate hydrolase protein [Penicillium capsulatum]|uniref:P-loop containing nucleoside triphosphate hydrolase protein n=1 Tax=Penicillium capsulatum TaxID=69766 RepID=A0A9W9LQP8_9EURO|nr:P-loop containing nucleoside triphosphate hydrolase protein [Penicillium capsulatum]KAJ6135748.1 P-loop containing nucleoside triphosphate hydrolase protein [Penicillium capsulatum]